MDASVTPTPCACRVPLAQLCAPTFEAQMLVLPFRAPGFCANQGSCGGYQVWIANGGFTVAACVYDSSGQQLLAGQVLSDAGGDFCNQTSGCAAAGQDIDVFRLCDTLALPVICPPTADAAATD